MSKSGLYQQIKNLGNQLGIPQSDIRSLYRRGTIRSFRNLVGVYTREVRNRDRNRQRAISISIESNFPLRNDLNLNVNYRLSVWRREVRRLQMRVRRRDDRLREERLRIQERQRRERQQSRSNQIWRELLSAPYTTTTKLNKNGSIRTLYEHKIPVDARINDSDISGNNENIRELTNIVKIHRKKIGNKRVQIIFDLRILYGSGELIDIKPLSEWEQITISTAYVSNLNEAIRRMIIEVFLPKAREYRANVVITKITVATFTPPVGIMGRSSRSIEKAHNKWHIISPKSIFNCVYQSIACCRNFLNNKTLILKTEEGHKKRVILGKNLKFRVKPSNDNYADNMSIQEVSNWSRYPIELYDNTYKLIKTFKPKNPLKKYKGAIKKYEIQRVGNHCLALIDKKLIKDKYPDFDFNKIEKLKEDKSNENIPIVKKRMFDTYNEKICTWDIETSKDKNGVHIPYACAIAWYEYEYGDDIITTYNKKCKKKDGTVVWKEVKKKTKNIIKSTIKQKQFWGLDCLQKFTKYIYRHKDRFHNHTLYAHNGGKYDLPLAIDKAFIESPDFYIDGQGCVELNNAWIGFKLRARNDRKFVLNFRDSYRLLPKSLDKLTKDLKVPHQKLTETINHNDITLINYNTFPELKKYLRNDVFGLLEVLNTFGIGVWNELGIDITKCFTGASLSKRNFFKNYYDTKFPIYKLSDDNDKFIRNSYFGGRVECFQLGEIGKNYYFDFTSLYPDVGRKNLPYGPPENIKFNKITKLPKDFFGFVQCLVKTKNTNHIPKHAVYKDNRLIFPIFKNWTTINVFSEELDYNQYYYEFISGIKFKKARIKQRFFTDGFRKKAQSKKDGNNAMAQAHKIIINSGYGFWGLKTKNRDGIIICEPNSHRYMDYLNTDRLVNIREKGDYMFCRIKKDLEVSDFNVGIAAAISSYARSKLHKLLTCIKNVGGEVYYCDTDSVISNININEYPKIKKQFQWDGNGEELGSLKNECDEYVQGKISKEHKEWNKKQISKELKTLRTKEMGNFHFDKGLITGCKQYALYKKLKYNSKDIDIEIVKMKGYSQKNKKLSYNDMNELLKRNGKITQKQNQFRCPKSNYVSETSSFEIRTKTIKKSFRKTYSKGLIFGKYILPHRI